MKQIVRTAPQMGEALRRIRRASKLTQAELGQKMGVRQATVSRLEAGERGTELGTLMDALAALNLELVIRPRAQGQGSDFEDLF
jgi:HTH-type transcriptional regulator / antitoxin HipB